MPFNFAHRHPTMRERQHARGFLAKTRFADDPPSRDQLEKLEKSRRARGLCPKCGRVPGMAHHFEGDSYAYLECGCGHIEQAKRGSRLFSLIRTRLEAVAP